MNVIPNLKLNFNQKVKDNFTNMSKEQIKFN